MIVRGARPADRFTIVANAPLEDVTLSWRSKGLLAYMLGRPEGWQTSAERLAKQGTEGRDAVRSALSELESAGYLQRSTSRDSRGRISTTLTVFDSPQPVTPKARPVGLPVVGGPGTGNQTPEVRVVGLPVVGQPAVGEPGLLSKTETKKELTTTPPLSTTSPVEDWTGPTEENLAWLAAQISTKVDGCTIDPTSITEKMLKARKPQMTQGGWMMAALALLQEWQSKEDAASTFKPSSVAGDEKIRLGKNDWRPSKDFIEAFTKQNPEYEHLWDRGVREEIARKMLDFIDGLKDRGEPYPDPFDTSPRVQGRIRGLWKTNVEMHYASAISQIVKRQNHQMTGTE